MRDTEAGPSWLPWAALLAVVAAYLLVLSDVSLWHPGYSYGDERLEICRLQDLREGAPFLWQFGRGCLSRGLEWAWVGLAGTGLATLHVPDLCLDLLAWLCLVLLARRWFGQEAAYWSVLALVVCAQTLVRARSLLAFQALPAETLLFGLLATRVRGRRAAWAWGLGASLLFLDYDGSFIAVPGMFCACLCLEPDFRRRWLPAALGLGFGGVVLALRQHADLAAYTAARLGGGTAHGAGAESLRFLGELVTGGPNLAYFGVTGWPAWPPWAWVGLAAGLWCARRSAALGLAAWAILGTLATQCVHSEYGLPIHRLAAVVPALALLTGLGFRALRLRLGTKAWVLGLILCAGVASEGWAWCRHQWAFGPELYDRCEALGRVRADYARDLDDPSTRVLTQFSGVSQADARFVLDPAPWPKGVVPSRVLALVPADYAAALKSLGVRGVWLWVEKGLEPALVARASGKAAARLEVIADALTPLQGREEEPASIRLARWDAWLERPGSKDPWVLTAALEGDLQEAVQTGGLTPYRLARLARTSPVSAAPWMVLARSLYEVRPRAALRYCLLSLALDPDNGEALLIGAACLRALHDPKAADWSRRWVSLRAAGLAWRHTL
ncbi:MAG: hypothetical protein ACREKE_08280 [bacterium]